MKSSRRAFLKTAGAAITFPTIIPSHVLGANAPSKTIALGQIGCGRIARDMDISGLMKCKGAQYVAVADCDITRANNPHFPAHRSDPMALSGASRRKQIPCSNIDRPEDTLLYRWVVEGKWKLLLTYDGKLGRYASSHPRTEKRPQLFDLLADPHEDTNLAAKNPEVVARLAARLQDWWPVTQRQVLTKWTDTPGQWK